MLRHLLRLALLVAWGASTPLSAASAEDPPVFLTSWGTCGSGPGQFGFPRGIDVAVNGDVFVCDWVNNVVQRFTNDGTYITTYGGSGLGLGLFNGAFDIAIDAGGTMYVSDYGNDLIQVFDSAMQFVRQWSSGPHPTHLALDPTGAFLYVVAYDMIRQHRTADASFLRQWQYTQPPIGGFWAFDAGPSGIIYKGGAGWLGLGLFDATGNLVARWTHVSSAEAVAVDADENVYATFAGRAVRKFASDGTFLTQWGSYGTGDGQFGGVVEDIAVDNTGNVFVVDYFNCRIQKFGPAPPVANKRTTWGKLKALYR